MNKLLYDRLIEMVIVEVSTIEYIDRRYQKN